jgi:hypothetical protein
VGLRGGCGRRGGGTGLELGGGIFCAGIFWFEGLFLGQVGIWGFYLGFLFWFLFGLVMMLRVVMRVMTGGQSVILGELPCLLLPDGMFFYWSFSSCCLGTCIGVPVGLQWRLAVFVISWE